MDVCCETSVIQVVTNRICKSWNSLQKSVGVTSVSLKQLTLSSIIQTVHRILHLAILLFTANDTVSKYFFITSIIARRKIGRPI